MSLCTICQGITINKLVPYCDLDNEALSSYSYTHQPTYNALVQSADTCTLCSLLLYALESCNAAKHIPKEHKDHENSNIWLLGGEEVFFDLTAPKRLSHLRVNVGRGGLIDSADLSVAAHPGETNSKHRTCFGLPLILLAGPR
jgi:hypothetical protein